MKNFIFLPLMLLSACSIFTPPNEQPVIEDTLGQRFFGSDDVVGTLSLTPERRVVLVNIKTKRFCAEAPSEVGQDLSKLVDLAAKGEKEGVASASINAMLTKNVSNSVLNKRTQGVQMLLAHSYFLCQMYMNEAITGSELLDAQKSALTSIIPVVEFELPLLYKSSKKTEPQNTDK
jgi:hypothetical protein